MCDVTPDGLCLHLSIAWTRGSLEESLQLLCHWHACFFFFCFFFSLALDFRWIVSGGRQGAGGMPLCSSHCNLQNNHNDEVAMGFPPLSLILVFVSLETCWGFEFFTWDAVCSLNVCLKNMEGEKRWWIECGGDFSSSFSSSARFLLVELITFGEIVMVKWFATKSADVDVSST